MFYDTTAEQWPTRDRFVAGTPRAALPTFLLSATGVCRCQLLPAANKKVIKLPSTLLDYFNYCIRRPVERKVARMDAR